MSFGQGPVIVLGDLLWDIVIKPQGPIRRGTDTQSVIRLVLGGQAANVAAHLAALGLPVRLLARCGDDTLGETAARELAREGVDLPRDPAVGEDTGVLAVLVDAEGQRTMFPQVGANACLDVDYVRRHWPADARALFVSGYSLLRAASRPAAQWAMAEARRRGIPVAVDPASYGSIEDAGAGNVLAWLEPADIVFPNRDEARVLTGTDDPDDMVSRLGNRFPVVALKLDKDGAIARAGETTCRVPAEPLPVVDTTGAGDAFDAAFLAAHLAGETLQAAVGAGVKAAARVIQRLGAR